MKRIIKTYFISVLLCILPTISSASPYEDWIQYMMSITLGSDEATKEQKEMLELALANSADFEDYLTADQIKQIKNYTISTEVFNYYLQQGYDMDAPQNAFARLLDDALDDLPTETTITYRGGSYGKGLYGNGVTEGTIIYNDTFSSSSYSSSVAKKFATNSSSALTDQVLFAIQSESGVNISHFSETFSDEAEVLIRPNTYFEVKTIRKGQDGIVYVAMVEVDAPTTAGTTVKHMYTGDILTCQ